LCGVEIPYESGLDGHSDADAAVHAVIDSILGALALGDIGQWFPDTDQSFKGADSMKLLETVMNSPKLTGWQVNNVDIVIIAQKPKLLPFVNAMRNSLAAVLNCSVERVSIKGKTTEKMGFCGRGEGIAASASVLMISK
jgi:2-C-methyl-D-erythritol 2,4-cyclodiphosphate synthase